MPEIIKSRNRLQFRIGQLPKEITPDFMPIVALQNHPSKSDLHRNLNRQERIHKGIKTILIPEYVLNKVRAKGRGQVRHPEWHRDPIRDLPGQDKIRDLTGQDKIRDLTGQDKIRDLPDQVKTKELVKIRILVKRMGMVI